MKVLVMDDEENNLHYIDEVLSFIGVETVLVRNSEEAVENYRIAQLKNDIFDYVILDLVIPNNTGAEATLQRLKLIDPEVKAILSTEYPKSPVTLNYPDYGFISVIYKPFIIENVIESLSEIINA